MAKSKTLMRVVAVAFGIALCLVVGEDARAQSTDPEAARIKAVMKRIRGNMREINELLLKGASDDNTAEKIEENIKKLDELLRETESKSKSVMQGIEELMSMAKPPQQQQQQGQGGDPQEQENQQQPRREKSEDPQQLQKQQEQEQQQDNPDQQQKEQKEDSPRPDQSPPNQLETNQPPKPGETGTFENVDTTGRWGILPPKEAEDLQRYNIDDFPQRYRHWMEMYYRRVNKSSPEQR